MRKKKITYFEARNDEYYMPSTNKQGWGSLFGDKTFSYEEEINGVRYSFREPLSLINNYLSRVTSDGGTSESTITSFDCLKIVAKYLSY